MRTRGCSPRCLLGVFETQRGTFEYSTRYISLPTCILLFISLYLSWRRASVAELKLNNLITVKNSKRIIRLLELYRLSVSVALTPEWMAYLAHGVDSLLSQLFADVFAFLQADTVLTSDCAVHSDCSLNHAVHKAFSCLLLSVVV